MIHLLLTLTRPLFVIDTETTGLGADARIVEIGFQQWTAEGMVKEWRSLINPSVPIPAAASAVHSITDETILQCQTCGKERGACTCEKFHAAPHFSQIAKSLATGFSDCDFAGKNVRFDLRIIAYEMKLARIPWDYSTAKVLDIDRLEQIAVPRNLGALHKKHVGHEHDGAHGALSDVRASTTVIVRQLEMYAVLPRDLAQLHALSWPGWLTADGSFKMVNGIPTCQFGKHRGVAMQDMPPSYFDWMLGQDFPDDVKVPASRAELGDWPTATPEETAAADKRMI